MSAGTESPNQAQTAKARIFEIHCPACGAPAYYDIKSRVYKCRYCGGSVGIDEAVKARTGFRAIQKKKINAALKNYELQKAVCEGCGAEVIFDKGDAVANCAFCGRALVREEYLHADDIPELVIPFSITKEEARGFLTNWCSQNSRKKEAQEILKNIQELNGFYLPYELVRGPVDCEAHRIDGGKTYRCGGFVDEVFVNCSKNLDNLLLDAMEPYNLDELTEFDFAYVAGHQVKAGDITESELARRVHTEIEENYTPVIQKTLETKAVSVSVRSPGLVRMPVLLPVYYISFGNIMAAVNGQTGKVSVRSMKESYYYILPWWLKAILSTVLGTGSIALGMYILGAAADVIYTAAGCLGIIMTIVMVALFSTYKDNRQNEFRVEKNRRIFTSKGGPYIRKEGRLVRSPAELVKSVTKPMFFMEIDGVRENVELKFTTFSRMAGMLGLALGVLFLPVIIALFINGFNFSLINLGGSAVWFCIFVPVIPVVLVKHGRIELYDNPWVYIINEKGQKKRWKQKLDLGFTAWDVVKIIITGLFKPPVCFGVWFGIICFCTMVYLTAFGDW